MVPITWDKIGMKNLTKRSFFSTSTKTVPINQRQCLLPIVCFGSASKLVLPGRPWEAPAEPCLTNSWILGLKSRAQIEPQIRYFWTKIRPKFTSQIRYRVLDKNLRSRIPEILFVPAKHPIIATEV